MPRLALLALLLAILTTLATCLFFACSAVTSTNPAQWDVIADRDADLANVSSFASFGKTIISWRPLPAEDRAELEQKGSVGPANIKRGPERPPSWSSYWDDAAFAEARAVKPPHHGTQRDDIAVGWPCRAFTCVRTFDQSFRPPAPVILGGVELPMLEGRGGGRAFEEQRAIPLRPIYSGLAINIAAYFLVWFLVLSVRRALVARRPVFSRPSLHEVRDAPTPRPHRPIHAALVVALLVLAAITTATVAILVPLITPMRWAELRSTTDAGASVHSSFFWTSYVSLIPKGDPGPGSADDAVALQRRLSGLAYTGVARDQAFSKLGYEGQIAILGSQQFFDSTLTGWPMRCLWGASWSTAASPTAPLATTHWNLIESRRLASTPPFNRGVRVIATRPLWLGWVVNTLTYAACWFLVWLLIRHRIRLRRARRGLCPFCAYDLRATPAGQPCSECGATVRMPVAT